MPAKKAKKKKIIKEDAKAKKKAKEQAKKESQKNKPPKVKIDPTFGLKNKKGSKNRRFVQNAHNNMNAEQIRQDKIRKEKKKERDMIRRMQKQEAALFQTVDDHPQFKKKKKEQEEAKEEKIELDDETMLDQCAPDELDDLIDKLRIKFSDRDDLTPVNPETFQAWMEKKEAEKAAKDAEKTKKKLQKKGKKGLTGRELFQLDASIFKDDEGAADMTIKEEEEKETTNDADTIAAVEDVGDASLFLDMGDMLDDETINVD